MIIDISQEILSCTVYPGDISPSYRKLQDMGKGDLYNLSAFSMCCHNGTHIDAPSHFIKDGKTIDMIPADVFAGCCTVVRHTGDITADDAASILKNAGSLGAKERVIIAGDATVTEDAAKVFADGGIKLLGVESASVGPVDAPVMVHKILLSRGVVLLENAVLSSVKPGRYFIVCTPLNIKGAEGSPCRAVLITE